MDRQIRGACRWRAGMRGMSRSAVVVLGMHRSGTSAMAQLLGGLGLALPRTLMPPTGDNPAGYFESLPIARFNKRMLESAGVHWRDWATVPREWFADPARHADADEARALLEQEFGHARSLVLKDPCLCRLMPLWQRALDALAIRCGIVLVMRRPSEVASSLAARVKDAATIGASVTDPAKCSLLWLRYMLDAESATRDMPRACVDYGELVSHPDEVLMRICGQLDGVVPRREGPELRRACESVQPALHRQRGSAHAAGAVAGDGTGTWRWSPAAWVDGLYEQIRTASASPDDAGLARVVDEVLGRLNRAGEAYAPMRDPADRAGPEDRAAGAALRAVAMPGTRHAQTRMTSQAQIRVLYVSGSVGSVGHELRVANPIGAWRAQGHDASWCAADAPDVVARASQAHRVVVFRAMWSPLLEAMYAECSRRSIPVAYDIDDLIFDEEVLRRGDVAYLDGLSEADRASWYARSGLYRRAMQESDEAVVTTESLARYAHQVVPRVRVLPNTLGPEVEAVADAEWRARLDHGTVGDSARIRLGYASGTYSHHRDFAMIGECLARVLRACPDVLLTVVGSLHVDHVPALQGLGSQIEVRPGVRWPELPGEVSRFDVNLAPLEPANPFCQCKSEIRCTLASMVGVPTVATPTPPQRAAIIDGVSGWLASGEEQWERALLAAVSSVSRRSSAGVAARHDVKLRFGWGGVQSRIAVA
ncbi:MAG: hypothetical protein FGM37_02885 [Phycisphaerales bacterium]|nr:hypothetical protein [Phycisphaerales bacterium]